MDDGRNFGLYGREKKTKTIHNYKKKTNYHRYKKQRINEIYEKINIIHSTYTKKGNLLH